MDPEIPTRANPFANDCDRHSSLSIFDQRAVQLHAASIEQHIFNISPSRHRFSYVRSISHGLLRLTMTHHGPPRPSLYNQGEKDSKNQYIIVPAPLGIAP